MSTFSSLLLSSFLVPVFNSFSLAVIPALYYPAFAAADEAREAGAGVIVRIRTVRATGAVEGAGQQHEHAVEAKSFLSHPAPPEAEQAASGETAPVERVIDDGLDDIGGKLRKLHYKEFTLACNQEVLVPLMKKRTVYLNDGNTLTVRPLYVDGDKVGLWLRWLDGSGTRILDTRMHFHERETMLTGTDGSANTGIVLAIDVKPSN